MLLLWRIFNVLWDIVAAIIGFLWLSPLISGVSKAAEATGGSRKQYFLMVLKFSLVWVAVYGVVYGLGSWFHGAALP
jgi:hypothetical protein